MVVDRDARVRIELATLGKPDEGVLTDRANGNCTFGEDGSTLFICADDLLVAVKTNTKGLTFANDKK